MLETELTNCRTKSNSELYRKKWTMYTRILSNLENNDKLATRNKLTEYSEAEMQNAEMKTRYAMHTKQNRVDNDKN